MTKGKITSIVALALAGIGLLLPGELRSLIFNMGVASWIGYGTNALAIRMLFDRMYLLPKWKKWPLPYSGILELEREKIATAIAWVVSKRLISQDAMLKMVISKDFRASIREIIEKKLQKLAQENGIVELLAQDLEKAFTNFVESDVFRDNLQGLLYQHFGKVGSVLVGSKLFRSKEMLTPYLQKEITNVISSICHDVKFHAQLRAVIMDFPEQCLSLQTLLEENMQNRTKEVIRELLEQVDIQKIVKEEISNFPPGELSGIVLKITAENLDWLEVWGGFLGAVAGGIFWTIERCF